jgi:hypothetical protein
MLRRLIALVLIAAVGSAGCATAKPGPPGLTPERAAQIRAECKASAEQGAESDAVKTGLKWGALSGIYLAFSGAAEGARFGAVTGGNAGEAAWIGAAAGAGLGVIIGFAAGIKKAVDAHRGYRARYEQCLAMRAEAPGQTAVSPAETLSLAETPASPEKPTVQEPD